MGVRVVSEDNRPDVCVYSVFGTDPLPPCRVKVFYSAENVNPGQQRARMPDEAFDFALTFSRQQWQCTNHKRLPNYAVALRHIGHEFAELTLPRRMDIRERFACFIHSNTVPHREQFVRNLMRYKQVDCPGSSLRNMSLLVPRESTIKFMSGYRFAVCFENAYGDGYVTEKIVQAFLAGSVPIYWGDPLVVEDFNPGSFINAHAFSRFEELIEFVAWVDQNTTAYNSLRLSPPLYGNAVPVDLTVAAMHGFWLQVFS